MREEAADSCWGDEETWDEQSPAFLEQQPAAPQEHWSNIQNTFGTGVEWLFRLMPGMRGKLYGRSLMPPCRCEACAYTLDTLIMFLDEDTMGWYTPDDIQHIMMDRFCYGIKWLYRSACHHILTAYFDDVAAMAMGHMTGLDICRVLRFCPYYYSGGNLWWSNMKAFPFFGGSASTTAPGSTATEKLGGTAAANLLAAPGGGQQLAQQMPPAQQNFMQQPPLLQSSAQNPMQQPAPQQPQLGALRAAAEARQQASTAPAWEHSLSMLAQPGAEQRPKDFAPVGYHTNPAAQQAGGSMSQMYAGR